MILPKTTASSHWNALLVENDVSYTDEFKNIHQSLDGLYFARDFEDFALSPLFISPQINRDIKMVSEQGVKLTEKIFTRIEEQRPGYLLSQSDYHQDSHRFFTGGVEMKIDFARVARPDIVLSNGAPKLIEMNAGSAIGGLIDLHEINTRFFNSEIARVISSKVKLSADSPMFVLANYLNEYALQKGLTTPPRVAILEWEFQQEMNHRFASGLRALGIPAAYINPDECYLQEGKLFHNGIAVDIGLKHYDISDLDFPEDTPYIEALYQATEQEKTYLMAHENASLLSDKRLLALLYRMQDELTDQENKFVRDYIPFTCVLDKSQNVLYQGNRYDIDSFLSSIRREEYLIKPGNGLGGDGVCLGIHCSTLEWEKHVSSAINSGNYVLQKFFYPDEYPLPFQVKDRIDWLLCPVVFSPFIFDYKANAGVMMRYTKDKRNLVINYKRGSFNGTCMVSSI